MPETVADLTAQLVAPNQARASGARTVTYSANGVQRSLEYRSDIELRNAQWDLQQRIMALQGRSERTVRIATNKGFGARRGGFGQWLASDAVKAEWERNHRDD